MPSAIMVAANRAHAVFARVERSRSWASDRAEVMVCDGAVLLMVIPEIAVQAFGLWKAFFRGKNRTNFRGRVDAICIGWVCLIGGSFTSMQVALHIVLTCRAATWFASPTSGAKRCVTQIDKPRRAM